jgi:hypothetical protein
MHLNSINEQFHGLLQKEAVPVLGIFRFQFRIVVRLRVVPATPSVFSMKLLENLSAGKLCIAPTTCIS